MAIVSFRSTRRDQEVGAVRYMGGAGQGPRLGQSTPVREGPECPLLVLKRQKRSVR